MGRTPEVEADATENGKTGSGPLGNPMAEMSSETLEQTLSGGRVRSQSGEDDGARCTTLFFRNFADGQVSTLDGGNTGDSACCAPSAK
jgi:hypothetical protein